MSAMLIFQSGSLDIKKVVTRLMIVIRVYRAWGMEGK